VLVFQDFVLAMYWVNKSVLSCFPLCKPLIQRRVMLVSPFEHFGHEHFVPQIQGAEPANPPLRLRMMGVAPATAMPGQNIP
jgi:hypothetical protein